jgi:hypothetical protein
VSVRVSTCGMSERRWRSARTFATVLSSACLAMPRLEDDGREVAAMDVEGEDEVVRIAGAQLSSDRAPVTVTAADAEVSIVVEGEEPGEGEGIEVVSTVEECAEFAVGVGILPEGDAGLQTMRRDVVGQGFELGWRQQREELGGRVDLQMIAPSERRGDGVSGLLSRTVGFYGHGVGCLSLGCSHSATHSSCSAPALQHRRGGDRGARSESAAGVCDGGEKALRCCGDAWGRVWSQADENYRDSALSRVQWSLPHLHSFCLWSVALNYGIGDRDHEDVMAEHAGTDDAAA